MNTLSKKEELTIKVILKDTYEVKTESSLARMVLFTGKCDCDNFKGKILEGAVDTQQMKSAKALSLSARYILEGVDKDGEPCRIFIENNGLADEEPIKTKPIILTDSRCLSYLNNAELEGEVENCGDGVIIRIYQI